MKRIRRFILPALAVAFIGLCAWYSFTQPAVTTPYPTLVATAPSGACHAWGLVETVHSGTDAGKQYCCISGTWALCPAAVTAYTLTAQEADGTPRLATTTAIKIDQATGLDMTSDGTSTVTIQGVDALADGTTKGVVKPAAADFDVNGTTKILTIDYTNGTAAATGAKGFLTAADWNTFSGKAAGADAHTAVCYWSDATATTHDTGTLVCTALGKTCTGSSTVAGIAGNCSTDYNPDGTAVEFYAYCQ